MNRIFKDSLVHVYEDIDDNTDKFLALNLIKNKGSYWYPSIKSLLENDHHINDLTKDEIQNILASYRLNLICYMYNGERISKKEALEKHPEYFI